MTEPTDRRFVEALAPVNELEAKSTATLRPGMALALSGGGYRAMLFHTGVLWRLRDERRVATLERISSVSGGSIVSALARPQVDARHGTGRGGRRLRARDREADTRPRARQHRRRRDRQGHVPAWHDQRARR